MASNILKYALFAGAGYVAYEFVIKPMLAGTTTTTGGGTPPPPAAPPTPPPPFQGANTIDGVYARMVAAAPSAAYKGSVDNWNVYLQQAMQSVQSGWVAPDPMPIFTAAIPGFSRSQLISASDYWAVMAPWMKSNAGLSGMGPRGLGWMYGLGRVRGIGWVS